MRRVFFPCTASSIASLTDVFDFLWPTAAAMWNLRWQVRGLVEASPSIDQATLLGRFVNGSGIQGVNLRRACLEQTWEKQQQRLAEVLLTSAFAIHESWCEQVLEILHLMTKENVKKLQYPTRKDATGKTGWGVGAVLQAAYANESAMVVQAIYPELLRHPKQSLSSIEPLLLCYRFFKELRNCLIHNGGLANQNCVDAYNAFSPFATPAALGLKECPQHQTPALHNPVSLSLRGVVGFSEVVLRIMVTLDSQLARNRKSEAVFISSWKSVQAGRPKPVLPADSIRKKNRLMQLVAKLGLYATQNTTELETFLRSHHLVA